MLHPTSDSLPPSAPDGPSGPALRVAGLKPRGRLGRILRVIGFAASLSVTVGAAVGVGLFWHYSQDLPLFTSIDDYHPKLGTRVYSADGRLIGEFGKYRRRVVPYERIPRRLIQALIATEDKKFFDHGGIDLVGIVRAVLYKVVGKSDRIGGTSTITQQLAKSLLIADAQKKYGEKEGFRIGTERSLRRKAREMILARRLEANLNKEEILWYYLNEVYLGHGAYGVQSAAEHYFRKDVEDLTLPEIALLAGLPQAPSKYSPLIRPKAARMRTRTVLNRLERNGFITAAQKAEALKVDLASIVKPRDNRFADTAPYFAEHVRRYIYDTYGQEALYEGGLQIYTTLDLERQHYAEEAMTRGLRAVEKRQGWRGALANLKNKKDWEKVYAIVREQVGDGELVPLWPYHAVVKAVHPKEQYAEVQIGDVDGIMPLAAMRWARKPNPNEYWEYHLVKSVTEVLKPGDVVLASLSNRKRMGQLAMDKLGWDSIPKRPKGARVPTDPKARLPVWARPLFELEQAPLVEGALIAMDPHTGYVEAMIGGYAFEKSEFNRAFQACRQPGSAFKPIVYSAAVVRENLNPATMILDTPITVRDTAIGKSWKPQNFEKEYKGEVTAREALMHSMNTPALKLMEKVGIKNVLAFAKRLGIKTELKEELGTAIGSSCLTLWELTGAYTTWARMGLRPEPVFIKRVLDRDGNVLEEHASEEDPWQTHEQRLNALYGKLLRPPVRVLDERDAFIVNYLLTQVATRGTAARASRLGHPVAGKTGTTNDSFDTWFAGFTPSLVTTVWVGYDTYAFPLAAREQGGRTSLPIWLDFMKHALDGVKEEPWAPPPGICEARVDSRTGYRVFENVPGSFVAPFRCGDEPKVAPVSGGSLSFEEAMKRGGL